MPRELRTGEAGLTPSGFEEFSFEGPAAGGGRVTRRVFRAGRGPGVLIIHELPGMVPECLELGRWVATEGFSAYLPLLFGEPGQRFPASKLFCLRHEFNLWHANRTSPILAWLRALSRRVADDCGPRVGAIGMCLTGSFAVALMVDESMRAPVVSQPSMPFRPPFGKREVVDLSPEDLQRAAALSKQHQIPVLAFRFEGDALCPAGHFKPLERAFEERFTPVVLPGKHHSVLTIHFQKLSPEDQARVRGQLREFLRRQLQP